ncbi:uncharacterized protein LOC129601611 isoform X2 [Paramacrobiotus metropolitanus]|nr:uncharacterized protein LOC129601611 isoform X2 [Paramacrobiotus metropolitanus]XP_055356444.1 uncharacterized protein LOC129601611 isoform X2 [Paramacrobiotus metropolitanus]
MFVPRIRHPLLLFLAVIFILATIYYFLPSYQQPESHLQSIHCDKPCMTSCGNQIIKVTPQQLPRSSVALRWFHVTDFNLICAVVLEEAWDSYADAFDEQFRRTFLSDSVKRFMMTYRDNCHPSRLLFGAFLGHSPGLGFGSILSNGLGAFHIAELTGRRYQIVHHEWPYEKLSTFFDDFAGFTPCPLFAELSKEQAERLLKNAGTYNVTYASNTVKVSRDVDAAPLNPSNEFNAMRIVLSELYREDFQGSFRTKSLLTKSVWQLKPQFREFIKVLLSSVLSQGFVGVHMRRTDKITNKEMADIPIERFADAIRKLVVTKAYPRCAVFVMTDDESACDLLRTLLRRDACAVYTIVDLTQLHGFNPMQLFVDPLKQVKHGVPRLNRAYWTKHTTQLIMELTILSLASDVVCTLSSNACNLVALLRGSHNETVHSLDLDWCPSNYTGYNTSCVLHTN